MYGSRRRGSAGARSSLARGLSAWGLRGHAWGARGRRLKTKKTKPNQNPEGGMCCRPASVHSALDNGSFACDPRLHLTDLKGPVYVEPRGAEAVLRCPTQSFPELLPREGGGTLTRVPGYSEARQPALEGSFHARGKYMTVANRSSEFYVRSTVRVREIQQAAAQEVLSALLLC